MISRSAPLLDRFFPKNPESEKRGFRLFSESYEIALGATLYRELIQRDGGAYLGPYQAMVEEIGYKLAKCSKRPDLPYAFTVINSNEIEALCMAGGKIIVYKGLIEKLDKEKKTFGVGDFTLEQKLAAVIGHEIIHATARHTSIWLESKFLLVVVTVIQLACLVLMRVGVPYSRVGVSKGVEIFFGCLGMYYNSRERELEADKGSIYNMVRAGYNPRAAIWLQKFHELQQGGRDKGCLSAAFRLLISHPDAYERAQRNERTIAAI